MTYALDRMSDLIVTSESAPKPTDFNPENYFKHAIGITADDKKAPEVIVFKAANIAAKYIESQPFHVSQRRVKEGKNRTTFELNILISEEFIRTILSYGSEIEIIAPLTLREDIIKRVQNVKDLYNLV